MRNGNWFLTYTGVKFYPLDPKPEDIRIEDIAHHLSLLCRFCGAVRVFYSVAEHSLHVSQLCPDGMELAGLLHDATEAYCSDIVRPLKQALPNYKAIEDSIWKNAVAPKFGLPTVIPSEVKEADNVMLMTERRDLLNHFEENWALDYERVRPSARINVNAPYCPGQSEKLFLAKFKLLLR